MSRKQLLALFICNLIPFIVGNSLISLMPIYIGDELGAGSIAAGITISIAFASLAISTVIGGKVARLFAKRTSGITFGALICIPSVWFMGQTDNVILFTVLFGMVWFFSGVQLVITQIIAALTSHENQRGWTFGVLIAAGSLAQLIGGLTAGKIVSQWGYDALFLICAGLYFVSIVTSLFIKDALQAPVEESEQSVKKQKQAGIGHALLLLVTASIVAHVANSVITMARPLVMSDLNFDMAAITSVIAISGLISLPLPMFAGWLSDRFGRKPALIVAYLVTALGASLFLFAGSLFQFWLAQAFVSVLACTMVVGTAFVMDLVPHESVDTGVSFFAATPWIGAVVGSTAAGFTMQYLGTLLTFEIAIALIVLAALLGLSIRSEIKKASLPQVVPA